MNHLKPVLLSDAVLMLNEKDFVVLANYVKYLREHNGKEIDLNFYQYKDNPGLICICDINGVEVGKIQLIADKKV